MIWSLSRNGPFSWTNSGLTSSSMPHAFAEDIRRRSLLHPLLGAGHLELRPDWVKPCSPRTARSPSRARWRSNLREWSVREDDWSTRGRSSRPGWAAGPCRSGRCRSSRARPGGGPGCCRRCRRRWRQQAEVGTSATTTLGTILLAIGNPSAGTTDSSYCSKLSAGFHQCLPGRPPPRRRKPSRPPSC